MVSQPLLVEDLEPGELPDAIDWRDLQLRLVAIAALVDVAPVADGAVDVPGGSGDEAAGRLITRDS